MSLAKPEPCSTFEVGRGTHNERHRTTPGIGCRCAQNESTSAQPRCRLLENGASLERERVSLRPSHEVSNSCLAARLSTRTVRALRCRVGCSCLAQVVEAHGRF